MTARGRFFAKVDKRPDGCWEWTGYRNPQGYGKFNVTTDKPVLAHRWSYEHHVGPIPDGLTIDHLCRVPQCVNPAHLEAVTHRVNLLRGEGFAAHKARQTHCVHGHEFTPENTKVRSDRGTRECRQCERDRKRRAYARKRATV